METWLGITHENIGEKFPNLVPFYPTPDIRRLTQFISSLMQPTAIHIYPHRTNTLPVRLTLHGEQGRTFPCRCRRCRW